MDKNVITNAFDNLRTTLKSEGAVKKTPTSNEIAAKRVLKKVGIGFIGTLAVLVVLNAIDKKICTDED